MHAPPGAGAASQGVKSASPTTSSPVPVGLLVALNGPLGEPQRLCGFLQAQTSEETQLDQLSGHFVLLLQSLQRLIQSDQLFVIGVERIDGRAPLSIW